MEKQTRYIIGDEWLYYKIYCGNKTADTILSEAIKPICETLLVNQHIDKFFFIRYTDPTNHIRVRFHLTKTENITDVIKLMRDYLRPYIDNDLVWEVMTDTYQQEISRYGSNSIELSENLFCNDSLLTINILSLIEGDEGERVRWVAGLRSVDEFINDFKYSLEEKFELMGIMKNSFEKEFNSDKHLRKQLSDQYRNESDFIGFILDPNNDEKSELNPIFKHIAKRSSDNKNTIEAILDIQKQDKLKKPLNEFMWSYLHMLNNRLFKSKQRLHELVIYYYLYQYYRSKLARMGVKVKQLEAKFNLN